MRHLAAGVWRQGPDHAAGGGPERGVRPGRRAGAGRFLRRHPGRADHLAMGDRRPEAGVPTQDPEGPDLVVPGLLRAQRRLGPGVGRHPGRTRRRPVGDRRPEGVDQPSCGRRLHLPAGPHRCRRPQARRDLVPAGAHGPARHRGAADHSAGRVGRVQRGVLRPSPLPEGQRGRGSQQRLDGGHDHPRFRARRVRHHRVSPVPPRAG